MKQKWCELTWPQRVVILLQLLLVLVFLILYCTLGRRQVVQYRGEELHMRTDGQSITYSGRLNGAKAVFTVSPGPVVEFTLDGAVYGPYTIVFDSTAVPAEEDLSLPSSSSLTGVEVWEGKTRLFRGAYASSGSSFYLVDGNGEMIHGDEKLLHTVETVSGTTITYAPADTPGPYSILKIALAPRPQQKGFFGAFFLGLLVCVACSLSILFADGLFRWNLRFLIRDAENAEPSDWELFTRWVGWIVLTILALSSFLIGLGVP